MKINEIWEVIKQKNVKFIQLQFSDLYGIVKSLTIPANQLEGALENGIWFDGIVGGLAVTARMHPCRVTCRHY